MANRSEAWLADELAKRGAWERGSAVKRAPDGTIAGGELPPLEFDLVPPVKYTPRKSERPLRPLEADIQAAVLQALALHPKVSWAKRMSVGMFKVQDAHGERWIRAAFKGCSDVIGQMRRKYGGKFIACEVKRPGEKPTPEQQAFLEHVRREGGVAFVAYSVNDVFTVLAGI